MGRFNTVLRHSSYLLGSKLLTRLLYTAFVVFAATRLGPETFGMLAFSLAMVELLSWIGDLGITRYGARELVARPGETATLNGQILMVQLASSAIIAAAGLAGILVWQPAQPKMQLLLMGLVAVLLSGVVNATESAFIATEKFFLSAVLSFTGRVIFLSIGFTVLALGYSVTAIMAGFLMGIGVESALRLVIVAAGASRFSLRFPARDIGAMLLASLPFAGAALASVVYSQSGIVALEAFASDAEVGVYSVAYNLFIPFVWVSSVMAKSIFPGLAQIYRTSREGARRYYYQWYRLLVMVGFPVAVAATLLARPGLARMPAEYADSATVVIILMWSLPTLLISSTELNILQIIGRERSAARALMATMALTVVLQLILVPLYGVVGAAAAALSGAVLRELQFYELVRRAFFKGKHYLVLLAKPLLAAAAMAGAALLAWPLGPWIATTVGAAAYVAAIFALGAVRLAEIKALARG